MPKIYELFGYPVSDTGDTVRQSRSKAYCPFISDTCDGGGNRYMSDIDLRGNKEMGKLFPALEKISTGVCSIQLAENQAPWIICPRRLLYMGRKADNAALRGCTQTELLKRCDFPNSAKVGIWSEVKVRYASDNLAEFDYTFDYVLMPLGKASQEEASRETGIEWSALKNSLRDSGHTFAMHDGETYIEDFPVGNPVIVEVMTSSTSGGNKAKRSRISQAFEDCLLGKPHLAPGINCRQVWARMASQLIVKSQAAMEWGGKTIWVLQDLLADYISASTALDLHKFIAQTTNEVNILAFSYGDKYASPKEGEIVALDKAELYAGRIRSSDSDNPQPCFQDIVLASVCPPRSILIAALAKKPLANRINL